MLFGEPGGSTGVDPEAGEAGAPPARSTTRRRPAREVEADALLFMMGTPIE